MATRITRKRKKYLNMTIEERKKLPTDEKKNDERGVTNVARESLKDLAMIVNLSDNNRMEKIFDVHGMKCIEEIILHLSCLTNDKIRERLRVALEEGYIYNSTKEMRTRLLPTPEPRGDSSTLFKDRHLIRSKMGLDNRNLNKFLKEP